MANGQFVAYYRVSTQRQGASGLGMEAQKVAVANFLNGGSWNLLGSFTEVETGKGANALAKRPQLRLALEACRKQGAVLLIAKLDRLARNVHFVSGLMASAGGNLHAAWRLKPHYAIGLKALVGADSRPLMAWKH